MTYSKPIVATLAPIQWQHCADALAFLIRHQTETLSQQNVGDREWELIEDYQRTLNDILIYILPQNK